MPLRTLKQKKNHIYKAAAAHRGGGREASSSAQNMILELAVVGFRKPTAKCSFVKLLQKTSKEIQFWKKHCTGRECTVHEGDDYSMMPSQSAPVLLPRWSSIAIWINCKCQQKKKKSPAKWNGGIGLTGEYERNLVV